MPFRFYARSRVILVGRLYPSRTIIPSRWVSVCFSSRFEEISDRMTRNNFTIFIPLRTRPPGLVFLDFSSSHRCSEECLVASDFFFCADAICFVIKVTVDMLYIFFLISSKYWKGNSCIVHLVNDFCHHQGFFFILLKA